MAVSYPASLQGQLEYPISVTTDAYPITIMWETTEPLTLYAEGRMICKMENGGSVQLKSAAGLAIVVGGTGYVSEKFTLGPNFPNPFNPVTRFNVNIPELTDLELAVYNVLGQKVYTVMSGEVASGSYDMEWDGKNEHGDSVPTGIYFIRMTAGKFKTALKIILIK
jgi:hypothetical protein